MSVSLYNNENFLHLCSAFSEYSEYFENDVMLNFITTHKKNEKKLINSIETVIHNQCEKMRLYNFMFYKLFVSKKYSNVTQRLKDVKSILNLVFQYNNLFMTINITNFEKLILEKSITKKSLSLKLNFLDKAIYNNVTSLKQFGYSIKSTKNERIYSLEYAVKYYGIQRVFGVFNKIQYLNSVLKEDFLYLKSKYHLFPGGTFTMFKKSSVSVEKEDDFNCYEEVQCGTKPEDYILNVKKISIGIPIILEYYDNYSYLNSVYFRNIVSSSISYKENIKTLYEFCYT
jgi:hypothetical protein